MSNLIGPARERHRAGEARDRILQVITDLHRCAKQNESDAKEPDYSDGDNQLQAAAVAGEQRRMIKILRKAIH